MMKLKSCLLNLVPRIGEELEYGNGTKEKQICIPRIEYTTKIIPPLKISQRYRFRRCQIRSVPDSTWARTYFYRDKLLDNQNYRQQG